MLLLQGLTGRQWYELDAVRAVNQAVGRVIRHVNDFGTIILCDCRFKQTSISNTLSAWLRSQTVSCEEFGQAFGRVSRFFKALGLYVSDIFKHRVSQVLRRLNVSVFLLIKILNTYFIRFWCDYNSSGCAIPTQIPVAFSETYDENAWDTITLLKAPSKTITAHSKVYCVVMFRH